MLTLAPLKDKEEIKKVFDEKKIEFDDDSGAVTAVCGNDTLGLCLYNLTDESITIMYIEPLTDIPLADGILRSTLHVAAERSIMKAYYAETVPQDFLETIKFIKSYQDKTLDIDKLFKSCCNCS